MLGSYPIPQYGMLIGRGCAASYLGGAKDDI